MQGNSVCAIEDKYFNNLEKIDNRYLFINKTNPPQISDVITADLLNLQCRVFLLRS